MKVRRQRSQRIELSTEELVTSTSDLIRALGRWRWFLTLTTREPLGPEQIHRRYRRLVRDAEELLGITSAPLWAPRDAIRHVLAWEPQRRGAWHLHALWASPRLERRARSGDQGQRAHLRRRWNRLSGSRSAVLVERARGVDWLVSAGSEPRGRRTPDLSGIARVELVRDARDVTDYCSKYVVKGGSVDIHVPTR